MTIISIEPRTPQTHVPLQITGNSVAGVGNVTIRETLGCFAKFSDWICCNTRIWQAFNTNLGVRHIDVQDDNLRNRLQAVYNPPLRVSAPATLSLDVYRDTRLNQACSHYILVKNKGDQEEIRDALNAIRNLIEFNADPFLKNEEGICAFNIANNDLELIKALTRTENVRAFEHCKTIHDFWEVVYPSSIIELPEGHEEWTRLLPESFLPERLQKVLSKDQIEIFSSLETIIEKLEIEEKKKGKRLTSQEIVDCLRSLYPTFDTICNEFGSNFPKIIEVPSTYFGKNRVHSDGDAALYQSISHIICIEETGNLRQKFINIFYEMMNALQKDRFVKFDRLLRSPLNPPREVYAFLMGYLEYDSARGFEIFFPKILHVGELRDFWIRFNNTSAGLVSLAYHFRKVWDKEFAFSYVLSQRQAFENRLKELST